MADALTDDVRNNAAIAGEAAVPLPVRRPDVTYQLVLATDDQITVWQTDFGHIFVFNLDPRAGRLDLAWSKDIPDAEVRAGALQDEARLFAEGEARARGMIA